MNNALKLIFATAIACGSASAVTSFNFNFATLGSNSNISNLSAFATNNGVSVTISSFYALNNTSALATATAANYNSAGLGICTPAENAATGGCASPEHQIDNSGNLEFMLFKFSTPVNLGSIVVANFGGNNDRDISFYTGNSSAAITAGTTTLNTLGANWSAATNIACGACSGSTSTYSLSGNSVSYLLIGAGSVGAADGSDYFKIQSLTSSPEPSTVSMVMFAVIGLGWLARRRQKRLVGQVVD